MHELTARVSAATRPQNSFGFAKSADGYAEALAIFERVLREV